MKRCPKCGKEFPDDANFCPVDAGRLAPAEDDPAATKLGPHAAGAEEDSGEEVLGGRFELGETLGGGRTGELREARDRQGGGPCVVKLVRSEVFPTPLLMQRTERELKQLERLDAAGVARVLDHGKQKDTLWIAVEKVEGTSLDKVIADAGPMEAERAGRIVHAVGSALAEAAKLGVIHRDLAPKNILLGPGDAVKIINFGIAVPTTRKVQGIPEFVAPEQVEGKPVDQRSNIYSLGALYYFLLAGRPPFQGDPEAVHRAHLQEEPPKPSSIAQVSEPIEALLLKALEKSSSKRYMTLRQLLGELEQVGDGTAAPTTTQPLGVAGQVAQQAATGKGKSKKPHAQTLVGMGAISGTAAEGGEPAAGAESAAPAGKGGGLAHDATEPVQALGDAPAAQPDEGAGGREEAPPPAAQVQGSAEPSAAAGAPVPNPQQAQGAGAPQGPMGAAPEPAKVPGGKGRGKAKGEEAPPASKKSKKNKFRETLWFKKGELDEAAAQAAAKAAAEGKEVDQDKADSIPIEDRYGDDGTVSAQDRERLSLRTGGTQMMKAVDDRSARAASEVSEDELVGEMKGGRALVIAGVIGGIILLVVIVLLAT